MYSKINRRGFIKSVGLGGSYLAIHASKTAQGNSLGVTCDNPYQAVDWSTVRRIGSGSHIHCRSQRVLERLHKRGIHHLAISNYYPSVPCSPNERLHQYHVEQSNVTLKGKGYSRDRFRWNEILTDQDKGWIETLPENLQKMIPFEVGPKIFHDIPDDVVICPNAEHANSTNSPGHFNSLGSMFASGTFDNASRFKLADHGYLVGLSMPWQDAFQMMIDELVYPDGGGITINHPVWSGHSFEQILRMLDFDPRVLGIEIWNHTCERINQKGWSLDLWDKILSTGRKCLGFCVSDHAHTEDPEFLGYNVLLINADISDDELPHACLKAYRTGCFYGVLQGKLEILEYRLSDHRLAVTANEPSRFRAISALGTFAEGTGETFELSLPRNRSDVSSHRYLRLEIQQTNGSDMAFTQPIFLSLQ